MCKVILGGDVYNLAKAKKMRELLAPAEAGGYSTMIEGMNGE